MASKSKQGRRKDEGQHRTVALNVWRIGKALDDMHLAWTSEKPDCLVSRATWQRLRSTGRVSLTKASQIADFLGIELEDLLLPEESGDVSRFSWPEHPEWEIIEGSAPWERTSNGLYFFRCKVRHKHLGDETRPVYGRARVYDLTRVPDNQRSGMREQLTRHPLVCRQLAQFSQFIGNLSVAPIAGEKIWWVVDEWIDGVELTEVMREGPLAPGRLHDLMRQVAEGLEILHQHDIVLRELSPRHLLVDSDEQVRFTELDLAKLLSGAKTVAAEWPVDPYRAPEVESGIATPQADYFSWAMMFLHAATGDSTLSPREVDALDSIRPSKELKGLLRKCLSPMRSKRPRSVAELLAALQ
jgi:serine/threonine protein kinase